LLLRNSLLFFDDWLLRFKIGSRQKAARQQEVGSLQLAVGKSEWCLGYAL
jgi:hypothetical protein